MAGFKISANAGAHKSLADITAASSAAGSAGVEVTVDETKVTSPQMLYDLLHNIADVVISQFNWPPA